MNALFVKIKIKIPQELPEIDKRDGTQEETREVYRMEMET